MIVLASVLTFASIGCGGQSEDTPASTGAVVVVQRVDPVTVEAGGATSLRLPIEVARGYHVQANPASDAFLVPLQLELDGVEGIEVDPPVYPKGEPYRLQGADSDLSTYHGRIEVTVPLRVSKSARPGKRVLEGELQYQACDARRCLFPVSVPVRLTVTISATDG